MIPFLFQLACALLLLTLSGIFCVWLLDYSLQRFADMRLPEAAMMFCLLGLTCVVLFMGTLDELTKFFKSKQVTPNAAEHDTDKV